MSPTPAADAAPPGAARSAAPDAAPDAAPPIRVLLCDDSVVIRGALARLLEAAGDIAVVARCADGAQAIEAAGRLRPDIAVLDIEMPVMDGLAALPGLLKAAPGLPVIMASTLTTRGADATLRALRLGAADYIAKPGYAAFADDSFRRELIAKVRGLVRRAPRPPPASAGGRDARGGPPAGAASPHPPRPAPAQPPRLLAIGASTGGPQALFALVAALGRAVPVPVVVTQHMPPSFTPLLAAHLDRLGGMPATEAADGEALLPGRLYLAPGDRHLIVARPATPGKSQDAGKGGELLARLSDGPPENHCRPAVDPMLRSAAEAVGGRVLVAMLTGMGQDGLEGTRAVIGAGGCALAQDEASSVVWGMPGAVARAGLCHAVLPLDRIAPRVLDLLKPLGAPPGGRR